jgi:hypothetical protein
LREVATNRLVICTLLRQLISVQSVNKSLKEEKEAEVESEDVAEEWLSILLMKLCRMGMLPEVYRSAGSQSEQTFGTVFPEQTILLSCLRHCLMEEAEASLTIDNRNPLGGEAGKESSIASHVFLVQQFSRIRTAVATDNDDDDIHRTLGKSAVSLILEILCEVLSVDSTNTALVRLAISQETSFLQQIATDLGMVFDHLSKTNSGRKAREVTMLDDEQQAMTAMVRVLGNLCFACEQNQDLLRTSLVPPTMFPDGSTNKNTATDITSERSALHVLLSCTSFSHSCFTLREWAVVAIRNVLDGNKLNQDEVSRLESQQPVQSAELQNMGVRVNLDPRGKVSVVPMEGVREGGDVKKESGDDTTSNES